MIKKRGATKGGCGQENEEPVRYTSCTRRWKGEGEDVLCKSVFGGGRICSVGCRN